MKVDPLHESRVDLSSGAFEPSFVNLYDAFPVIDFAMFVEWPITFFSDFFTVIIDVHKNGRVSDVAEEKAKNGIYVESSFCASMKKGSDFKECKRILVDRGELFLKKAAGSRKRIAKLSGQFIRDGATILTHSKSRGVLQLLKEAVDQNKRFQVYVTESMPDMSGNLMHKELQDLGIPSTVILDSAVGYIMERVDMVLVGAEGVGESGGLINKVGTYQLAVMAKAMSKPVYAVAESFKFQRIYPLNQKEVPNKHKYCNTTETGHPLVDYTPPSYITLLFTDLGVLTPSAVSDELINLYC
eukprot:gene15867-7195_t